MLATYYDRDAGVENIATIVCPNPDGGVRVGSGSGSGGRVLGSRSKESVTYYVLDPVVPVVLFMLRSGLAGLIQSLVVDWARSTKQHVTL